MTPYHTPSIHKLFAKEILQLREFVRIDATKSNSSQFSNLKRNSVHLDSIEYVGASQGGNGIPRGDERILSARIVGDSARGHMELIAIVFDNNPFARPQNIRFEHFDSGAFSFGGIESHFRI